jgi:hypothetical protein
LQLISELPKLLTEVICIFLEPRRTLFKRLILLLLLLELTLLCGELIIFGFQLCLRTLLTRCTGCVLISHLRNFFLESFFGLLQEAVLFGVDIIVARH